jgi:hypothetical protein
VLFILGLGLIIHQARLPRAEFNLSLMVLGALMSGVPGLTQFWSWRTGSEPSSLPAEQSLSQSSLSSPVDTSGSQ